jgi:hypothetical protein
MAPIKLCAHPGIALVCHSEMRNFNTKLEPCEAANNNLQQIIARRGRELSNLGINATLNRNEEPAGNAHCLYDSSPPFSPLGLPDSIFSALRSSTVSPPALVPLNECILAIAWEFHTQPWTSTITGGTSLEDLINLLRRSAVYQAKLESVSSVLKSDPILKISSWIAIIEPLSEIGWTFF